jgi:hypothetical protein
MPLKPCAGGKGWQYGNAGKCYTGKDAKKKAIKQGIAEMGPEKFKEEMAKASIDANADLESVLDEMVAYGAEALVVEPDLRNPAQQAVLAYISKKERDKVPAADFGWPEERKYPVRNQDDLNAAVKLVGRAPADKQGSIKSKLKSIAKRKGLKLPDSWEK